MLAETICTAVSAAGLGIAAITAYRKRFLRAARIAAYALVPLGLVMTGTVQWLADTAFDPVAWAGFGVLGAAGLLFAVTRGVERRRGAGTARREPQGRAPAGGRDAVAPPASGPALEPGRRGARKAAEPGDDFSEIEEILKKHGI
ncbi:MULTISPECIES: hypothetical protein [unclassified Streptomyces]|uniref:hypothetical protein n=1 Tax=unclassified Streptomyces TaxID=2593676 RepID=UPI0008DDDB68|nr:MULTISPECIES: hypothetical protein [unclassified Streptomyces]OII68154.1 hypothetical protein BJP39_22190 [Streptomyces sp. CC77]